MIQRKLVDKSSPVPAYHQIENDLAERIAAGEWPIHGRMSTEAVLAEEYGVSRVTLRKALANLESRKLIDIQQGRGIFVSAMPKPFIEDLNLPGTRQRPEGSRNRPQLLKLEPAQFSPSFIWDRLQIPAETPLVYIERLFLRDSVVLGLGKAWLPQHKVPGLLEHGLVEDSVSKTITKLYGSRFHRVESYLEAARLNPSEAARLQVPYDSTAMKIQSTHHVEDDSPLQFTSTLWVGELTRFHIVVNED